MRLVTDDRCRLQSRDLFKPNTPYQAERLPNGRVEIVELVESDVPLVKPRRVGGKLRWPQGVARPTRQQIAAAIRADRDSR